MQNRFTRACLFLVPLLGVVACSANNSKVKREALGQRPPVPEDADLSDDRFEPEANTDGTTPLYRVKTSGNLHLGKNDDFSLSGVSNCKVKQGDILRVIGKIDRYHLVVLSNPCQLEDNGGKLEPAVNSIASKGESKGNNKVNVVFVSEGYYPSKYLEQVSEEELQNEVPPTQQDPGIPPSCRVSLNFGSQDNPLLNKNSLLTQADTNGANNDMPLPSLTYPGPQFRNGAKEGFLELRGLPSSFSSVKISMKNYVVNGYANSRCAETKPTIADNTAPKKPGSQQLQSNFAIPGYNCNDIPEKELAASEFTQKGDFYAVPMSKFVPNPNDWMGSRVEVKAVAMVDGKAEECASFTIQLLSPLVLDFTGNLFLETKSLAEAVSFDMNADGRSEKSGWISGGTGLLAIDRNGNGVIDDGSELFGDATRARNGKHFTNGFEALSALDFDGNGKITNQDLLYSKLVVWFDRNSNGQTEAGELVSLADAGVSSIDLSYAATGWQSTTLGNDVPYVAGFSGSGCRAESCHVYDVYFSSMSELTQR